MSVFMFSGVRHFPDTFCDKLFDLDRFPERNGNPKRFLGELIKELSDTVVAQHFGIVGISTERELRLIRAALPTTLPIVHIHIPESGMGGEITGLADYILYRRVKGGKK